ncbi:MAG TPA: hypothetical protein VNM87_07905 [Candidatus Udaeobacter sp.]|nr:hypothetical protein [Candidatus Udaeobacter sp.]
MPPAMPFALPIDRLCHRALVLAAGWIAIAAGSAAAGSAVNVDLHRGAPDPINAGTPSSAYSAASGQSGEWNGVSVLSFGPHALLDRTGGVGPVLNITSNAQGVGGRIVDNPSTTGDDAALLDDAFNIPDGRGSFVTLTLTGLAPNVYRVYTYAWDPAFTASKSVTVDVNGTGAVLVSPSSEVFSGFVAGETHAEHTVVLAAGEPLVITAVIVLDLVPAGVVNGFQVVPQGPEPVEDRTWGAIKAIYR